METCVACGAEAHPDGWYESLRLVRGSHPDDVVAIEPIERVWFCVEHKDRAFVVTSADSPVGTIMVDGKTVGTMQHI